MNRNDIDVLREWKNKQGLPEVVQEAITRHIAKLERDAKRTYKLLLKNGETVNVKATPVTISGFEEYNFIIHRILEGVDTKGRPVFSRKGWQISHVESGSRVKNFYDATKEETIKEVGEFLKRIGKARVRSVIKKMERQAKELKDTI